MQAATGDWWRELPEEWLGPASPPGGQLPDRLLGVGDRPAGEQCNLRVAADGKYFVGHEDRALWCSSSTSTNRKSKRCAVP